MTPTDFKNRFPEFKDEADDRIQMFIDDADPFFDQSRWDDLYEVGVAYFVAHEMTIANIDSKSAIFDDVTSKKVGDVSKTRDAVLIGKQADNPFMRTKYGQKYLYYMNFIGSGATAV